MGFFNRKKFGLAEALVVVERRPKITPDTAKDGVAFVEALKIPVTVIPETEAKIVELANATAEAQRTLFAVTDLIREAEKEGKELIEALKAATKKVAAKIAQAFAEKGARIEDARALIFSQN